MCKCCPEHIALEVGAPVELPLTVVDHMAGQPVDVVVRCDPSSTIADVVGAALAVAGSGEPPRNQVVRAGDDVLAGDQTVATAGLVAGAVLTVGGPGAAPVAPAAALQLVAISGVAAGMVVDLGESTTTTIGRSARCDVVLEDDEVSRLHAQVVLTAGVATIEDLHSANGTVLNQVEVAGPTVVRTGDLLGIGGSVLTIRPPLGPLAGCEHASDGRLRYNRPPRHQVPAAETTFEAPEEPQLAAKRPFSILAALSPLVLGVVIAVATGQYAFLLFSLASPVMLGANVLSDRRSGRRSYDKRSAEHDATRKRLVGEIAAAVAQEEQSRRAASPDPAAVSSIVAGPTQRLWERRREDGDFLRFRVGLADQPARVTVNEPRGSRAVEVPPARAVPVEVDLLGAGVVGLAGSRPVVLDVVRAAVLQLCALHSPNDLSLVFLAPSLTEGWNWLKWLPHLSPGHAGSDRRLVGVDTEGRRDRIDELVATIDSRRADRTRRLGPDPRAAGPAVVVVFDGVARLREEEGVAYALREGPAVGVVALCVADDRAGLPAEAKVSIECVDEPLGAPTLTLSSDAGVTTAILPDRLREPLATVTARRLAPLFEVAPVADRAQALPGPPVDELGLLGLELPSPAAILARWGATAGATPAPAVIGVGESGPYTFDLVRDGAHVLVAGTTGAGKSELLQTLVVALAGANRPDVVTFLLVDFKGGSSFKDCARLPHTLGVISNLDSGLVERALVSLQAELDWRMALFRQAGVADYEEHAAGPGRAAPLPRLVVVVDELKELADAYADSIPRLNRAAALGRSLGVHLVLATQKPSLVPGLAGLRANTDLRISLRVQDDGDSKDILDAPDAAAIRRSDVGRAIARPSDGDLVRFQTGYLGGPAPRADDSRRARTEARRFDLTPAPSRSDAPRSARGDAVPGPSALEVLVDAIAAAAPQLHLAQPRLPWLPPLPADISLDDGRLDLPQQATVLPVGLIDLPEQQRQEPLVVDLDQLTHLLVIGGGRSGRTTLLRTLAGAIGRRSSPADVHLYCLECRRPALGDLAQLPHCGGVIGMDDTERLERFLRFLQLETQRRASLMAGRSSLAEQRASPGPEGPLPYLVVLCDNYDGFYERFSYEDGGRLVEVLNALLSDGPARGIHFVVTTDRQGLRTKLGAGIEARLMLRPRDRDDLMAMGWASRTPPSDLPPGRGLWHVGPAEVQVALLPGGGPERSQTAAIATIAGTARSAAHGDDRRLPVAVPPLPSQISATEVSRTRRVPRAGGPTAVTLGVGGVEVAPLDVDLEQAGSAFVVAGPRGSGRSTALLAVAESLLEAGPGALPLCVLAPRPSLLRNLLGRQGVTVLTSLEAMPGELADALGAATGRLGLIVDDAELLLDTPASARLDRVVRAAADLGWVVVIGGTATDLARRFSGWVYDARQSRTGLILQPTSAADGDVLDLRLPRTTGSGPPPPPGRGVLAVRGVSTAIQVVDPTR